MTAQSEMAQKVLDAIAANPSAFDMDEFVRFDDPDATNISPGQPLCCTTLCVAGFVAYLTGWTLVRAIKNRHTSSEAEKEGVIDRISSIGAKAFEIQDTTQKLFYACDEVALAVLNRMAAGEQYTDDMVDEESIK